MLALDEDDPLLLGHLSGGVSAHAVRYNEETAILVRVGIEVVLVALSQTPGIGSR
jgi:hypothetical protein